MKKELLNNEISKSALDQANKNLLTHLSSKNHYNSNNFTLIPKIKKSILPTQIELKICLS